MPPAGSLPRRAPARPPTRSRTRAAALAAVAALALAGAGCRRGAEAADLPPGAVVAVAGDADVADAVASAPSSPAPPTVAPRTAAPRTAAPRTAAPDTTSTTPPPSSTSTTTSEPGSEVADGAAPPTLRAGRTTPGVFRADGLGFARFGDDAEATLERLVDRFGAPDFDSAWATEDGETFRQLNFGLLTVDFREEDGARTFTGAHYLVPAEGTAAGPVFETDPPHGLDGSSAGSVTFARLTGGAALSASPELPGAWCFTTADGPLCAYPGNGVVDEHGSPAANTPVVALLAGRIAFRGHCGL